MQTVVMIITKNFELLLHLLPQGFIAVCSTLIFILKALPGDWQVSFASMATWNITSGCTGCPHRCPVFQVFWCSFNLLPFLLTSVTPFPVSLPHIFTFRLGEGYNNVEEDMHLQLKSTNIFFREGKMLKKKKEGKNNLFYLSRHIAKWPISW